MILAAVLLAAIAVLAFPAAASEAYATSSLTFDAVAAKNRPVTKVITLLKDMMKELEKDAEEDEEIYDKMACWCETNDKEKAKAIADAEAHIEDLESRIEELTALSSQLNTEIAHLKEEVAKNQEALEKATAIRSKQIAEFKAEEEELLQSISALKSAIQVLSEVHETSLLQMSRGHATGVASTLQHVIQRHPSLLKNILTGSERKAVQSFIQAQDYFDAAPTFKQSYAPQSGQIFGILKQMKETFETDLADAQKEELANQKAYEDLKAAKEAEIAAGKQQIETKTQELATVDEENAQAKEDLEDTKESLSADQKFLMMLKEKCSMTDKEMEERQKTRNLEIQAISKALAVLSTDDAQDLFASTFTPALLQISENPRLSKRRLQALEVIRALTQKHHSPRLAVLATSVRLDAFSKVKKAINEMIAQLLKEKEDEIKHKDFCVDELNTNQLQTEKKEREKTDLLGLIDELDTTIDSLTKEIDTLKAEISEMQVELKKRGEDRESESRLFQQTVADQRASKKLLQIALNVLQGFYDEKEEKLALAQKQEPVGPPPPPGFEAYKKNEAAPGVMGQIQIIIDDAKAMEAEAIKAEEDSQASYEAFVKETNESIETKTKEIVNKSADKAKTENELVMTKEEKDAVLRTLEELATYNSELHEACDFVLKNFEIRQSARDEEIEALKQALAILNGAKFD